jgi:type II secretory pathway pseudopilin PulG
MRAKRQVGYTILEVLIFIAVSSLMFISAMRAISGRQRQVQFTQSIQEFDAKIKDLINDVTTSYYPTNENVSCEIIGSEISISKGSDQKIGH